MVSSVDQVAAYQVCSHPASVCLVDHVLHGDCPDVMTLGSQRRTVAYYTRGGIPFFSRAVYACAPPFLKSASVALVYDFEFRYKNDDFSRHFVNF